MMRLLIIGIRFYQTALSPFLGVRCRFVPSCSDYMAEALQSAGTRQGLVLGMKRLLRCHPLGGHGLDPVPPLSQRRAFNQPGDHT